MEKKVFVLYDTTKKKCDKLWVAKGLEKKGYDVKIVPCMAYIFAVEQRGKLGKIVALCLIFFQCMYALMISKKDDKIFCWNQWTGLIMNLLAKHRYIISYNWLTPRESTKKRWVYARALCNPKFVAVINSKDSHQRILEQYEVKDIGNIHYIPDVYDNSVPFVTPQIKDEKKIFMGGVENRDWRLFLKIAEELPNITFIGITTGKDRLLFTDAPKNVKMYFDLPASQYYKILEQSYICLCLLKENRVSGLINIIKAAQYGKIMLATKMNATESYFDEKNRQFLIEKSDDKAIHKMISAIIDYSPKQYMDVAEKWQMYIKGEYSPMKATEEIAKLIEGMTGTL